MKTSHFVRVLSVCVCGYNAVAAAGVIDFYLTDHLCMLNLVRKPNAGGMLLRLHGVTDFTLLTELCILNRTKQVPSGILLQAMPPTGGQLYMVLSYVEHSGAAYLGVTWDAPAPGNSSWVRHASYGISELLAPAKEPGKEHGR